MLGQTVRTGVLGLCSAPVGAGQPLREKPSVDSSFTFRACTKTENWLMTSKSPNKILGLQNTVEST